MKRRNVYTVGYRMNSFSESKRVDVISSSKEDAYLIAVYEVILEKEGFSPYNAWVESVTYQNGNVHEFSACECAPF